MKIKEWLKALFLKLAKTDDTPHRIALGFAIGIFYGLFPFVGVIFTLVTAFILKGNKISALIGCFVTNTWLSVILVLPSVKIGSKIFGLDWRVVWSDMLHYLKISNINDFFKAASSDVIIPSLVGFLTIALLISLSSYFIVIFLIIRHRAKKM